MTSPQKTTAGSVDADRVVSLLTEITRASTAFKPQTAIGYVRNLLTELPSLKTPLRTFQNTLISVQEGLGSRDLTQAQARAEIKEANSLLETAVKALLSEISVSEQDEDTIRLDQFNDSLLKFNVGKNDLQTKLMRSQFVIALTTVVPITTPFLSDAALRANGFKAERFHGYCLLDGQMVAGLHSDYVKKHVKDKADADGPAKSAEDVFQDFVDMVKAKHRSQKLMQLGGPVSWWDTSWVWLIPERQYKVLRACTTSGPNAMNLNIRSWGFPFDRQ